MALVAGEVVAGAVVVIALLVLVLVLRLRSLTRRRGTFDCALRPAGASVGVGAVEPWGLGVARTGSETVRWWPSRSFSWRPGWSARRSGASVESRVRVTFDGGGTGLVVRVHTGSATVDLLMDDDAYTGFAAWLESAPPRDRGAVR